MPMKPPPVAEGFPGPVLQVAMPRVPCLTVTGGTLYGVCG